MKAYIKPELFYERYEVSQHIADCAWEFQNQGDPSNCVAVGDSNKLPGMPTLFQAEGRGCQLVDAVDHENYCYQNSADGVKLHTS